MRKQEGDRSHLTAVPCATGAPSTPRAMDWAHLCACSFVLTESSLRTSASLGITPCGFVLCPNHLYTLGCAEDDGCALNARHRHLAWRGVGVK
eukprot:scaffold33478_cov39-Isochrysis_galbana.AAC.1